MIKYVVAEKLTSGDIQITIAEVDQDDNRKSLNSYKIPDISWINSEVSSLAGIKHVAPKLLSRLQPIGSKSLKAALADLLYEKPPVTLRQIAAEECLEIFKIQLQLIAEKEHSSITSSYNFFFMVYSIAKAFGLSCYINREEDVCWEDGNLLYSKRSGEWEKIDHIEDFEEC